MSCLQCEIDMGVMEEGESDMGVQSIWPYGCEELPAVIAVVQKGVACPCRIRGTGTA